MCGVTIKLCLLSKNQNSLSVLSIAVVMTSLHIIVQTIVVPERQCVWRDHNGGKGD